MNAASVTLIAYDEPNGVHWRGCPICHHLNVIDSKGVVKNKCQHLSGFERQPGGTKFTLSFRPSGVTA
jgi:hypothetical protein